jgi:hypothetical protein
MVPNHHRDPARYATHDEAACGIYIDFEGFSDKPPLLIGVLYPERFEQVVLDPALEEAANAKNLKCEALEPVITTLLDECAARKCGIFAFTRHELNVVSDYTALGGRLKPRYRDGHKIAKRWFNRFHHGEPIKDWSLGEFLKFIGHPQPAWMGNKKATHRLRSVMEMLDKRGEYGRLTPTAKQKWTKLLAYNRADCEGLRLLVTTATRELN